MRRLDVSHARYDRNRDALVVPGRGREVVITLGALEDQANRRLAPDEAVNALVESAAVFRAAANAAPEVDGVVTVTARTMRERDWHLLVPEEQE